MNIYHPVSKIATPGYIRQEPTTAAEVIARAREVMRKRRIAQQGCPFLRQTQAIAYRDASVRKLWTKIILWSFLNSTGSTSERVRLIICEVAAERDIDPVDIMRRDRRRPIAQARREAICRVWERNPRLSLPKIGQLFNGIDHTSVLHAIRKGRGIRYSATQRLDALPKIGLEKASGVPTFGPAPPE